MPFIFFFFALPNAIGPSVFIPKRMRNEFRALKCLMFCFINHSSTHIENKFNLWLPKPYKLCIQALATSATQSMWYQSSWITIYCMNILKMQKKNYRRHWWRWKRLQKLLLFRLKKMATTKLNLPPTHQAIFHILPIYIIYFPFLLPYQSFLSFQFAQDFQSKTFWHQCIPYVSVISYFFSNHSTWERH